MTAAAALVLLRHGAAGRPRSALGDASRALTATGKAEAHRTARVLRPLLAAFPLGIWSSPARRCLETAEVVRSVVAPELTVQECEALGLDASPSSLLDLASSAPAGTLLVGHQPVLVQLAHALCAGRLASGFDLATASACGLVAAGDHLELAWHVGPDDAPELASP